MPGMRLPTCTKCGFELPEGSLNRASNCPACDSELRVVAFPALFRSPDVGPKPELIVTEGEAACFYHPEKRAVAPCDVCGRFLCALCDIALDGRHYCPACVGSPVAAKSAVAPLELKRARYDQMIWSLLILPIPLCLVTAPFTATSAVILAVWKWNAPPSLVSNTRLNLILGLVVALIELGVISAVWLVPTIMHLR